SERAPARVVPAAPSPATTTPNAAAADVADANATAKDAEPAPVDIESLTFEQKIAFLETSCLALPCAKALVAELRGLALSELSTQRLATAVDDVKRCLHQCAD